MKEFKTCAGVNLTKGQLVRVIAPSIISLTGTVAKVALSTYGKNSSKNFLKQYPPFNMWDDYSLDMLVLLEMPDNVIEKSKDPLFNLLRKQTNIHKEGEIFSYLIREKRIMNIVSKHDIGLIDENEKDFWYKAYKRIKQGKANSYDFDPMFAAHLDNYRDYNRN